MPLRKWVCVSPRSGETLKPGRGRRCTKGAAVSKTHECRGEGVRVLPAGASRGPGHGVGRWEPDTPSPERGLHAALPRRSPATCVTQQLAASRGETSVCFLELPDVAGSNPTAASQAGTGDAEIQGAFSPLFVASFCSLIKEELSKVRVRGTTN